MAGLINLKITHRLLQRNRPAADLQAFAGATLIQQEIHTITLKSGSAASQSFRFQTAPSPRQHRVDGGQERSKAGIDKRGSDAH
jgi:hypothetical protein